MPYKYTHNFKTDVTKEDTQELDELYRKLCKTYSSDLLKTMFSSMILLRENFDKSLPDIVPENLKEKLIFSLDMGALIAGA